MDENAHDWDFRADLEKAGLPTDLNLIVGRRAAVQELRRRLEGLVVGVRFDGRNNYDEASLRLIIILDGPRRPRHPYNAWFVDRHGGRWSGGPDLATIRLTLF
jgi:hypothetical protein